jgi:tetratricopeptide (TPR) repeat protein
MSIELFDIPVSLLHRKDQAPDLVQALIPYDAYQWQEALGPLEEVARTGNILAIFKYANTLGNIGETEAAEHFWRIAIAAGHTDSCNNLANLLKNQGRIEEVLPLYRSAAEGGAPDGMFNLANYIQEEDPVGYLEWMVKAIEAGHARACANLAIRYFDEGKVEEAMRYAELGISRGCIYSASSIALYHQKREEYEMAVQSIQRAFPLFNSSNTKDQVHPYNLLAFCLLMLSRFDEAEAAIEHCREYNSAETEKYVDLLEKLRAAEANNLPSSPKFCPSCGTPVGDGNAFCTGCGKSLASSQNPSDPSANNLLLTKNSGSALSGSSLDPSQSSSSAVGEIVVSMQVEGNTFGAFEKYVADCEEVITPYLNGAISIDGGMLAIAGEALPGCETCYGYSDAGAQFDCSVCGRTNENYIHVRSGFGDGIYLNFDLYWGNICGGTMTILDEGNAFASKVFESLQKMGGGDAPFNQDIEDFWENFHATDKSLELHYFGTVQSKFDSRWSTEDKPYGSLFFGDTGEGIDSLSSVIYAKNMPVDRHRVYGFCERNDKGVLIPRLVMTLREEVATKLGLPTSNPNMAKEFETWQHAGVFASIGGKLREQAVMINVAAQWAALSNPNFDEATLNDHQTLLFSWSIIQYYQGSMPPGLMDHLKDLTLNMVKIYLRYRTCFGLADQLTSWPPAPTNKLGV